MNSVFLFIAMEYHPDLSKGTSSFLFIALVLPIALASVVYGSLTKEISFSFEEVEVFEKHYAPDTNKTHIAPGFSTGGKMTITVLETGHNEKYILLLKKNDGTVFTKDDKGMYSGTQVGQKIQLKWRIRHSNWFGKFEKIIDWKVL